MSRRTREKQLAKLAARRQAERQAAKRRRDITLGIVGGLVGLALLVVGYTILTGFLNPQIDNFAHIGGCVGGAVMGAVLPRRRRPDLEPAFDVRVRPAAPHAG